MYGDLTFNTVVRNTKTLISKAFRFLINFSINFFKPNEEPITH